VTMPSLRAIFRWSPITSCGSRTYGDRVLDLACGTGNAAIAARYRRASVTGLDLTPELLAVARARAVALRLEDIAWLEGDAEDLPFEAEQFDVVISSCGVMFAPRQELAAAELARVTRRGGRIALQAWSPSGGSGRMARIIAAYAPAPPPGTPSPFAWGDPGHARTLLDAWFEQIESHDYDCPVFADSPETVADRFVRLYGPTARLHASLAPERASALREELLGLYRGYATPADGKVRWGREYIVVTGRRRQVK